MNNNWHVIRYYDHQAATCDLSEFTKWNELFHKEIDGMYEDYSFQTYGILPSNHFEVGF